MIISSERNIAHQSSSFEGRRVPYRFVILLRSIEENAKLILSWVPWLL